jgi:hypothetical protein
MGKAKVSYSQLVEMAKQCGTLEELSVISGITERALRRRFQRKGTTFTGVKGGIEGRSSYRLSDSKRNFLSDLRQGDPYVVALNRKLKELKTLRNRLITERLNGWQQQSQQLTGLIDEYEELIETW